MSENKTKNKKNSFSCCCGQSTVVEENTYKDESERSWVTGKVSTPAGDVLQVATTLHFKDILGSWKARWGINRHNYAISPGLYCVGNPKDNSPVLVTANYKMTFDRLRKELVGLDAWLLVLDTKGINVWCAAGKGTFGTEEVIKRIEATNLSKVVSHRNLILPQLGAPGVAAHEVLKKSGFRVIYGPIRAIDVKPFIEAGMKATDEMRTVKFPFKERLILTPIELVHVIWPATIAIGILIVLNLLGIKLINSISELIPYVGAILIGTVIAPVLLPWIPGRAFAWKGWLLGFLWAIVTVTYLWYTAPPLSLSMALFYLLTLPPISSFLAMNYTGASTFTSLSGVRKEMAIWMPIIIFSLGIGILLIVLNTFKVLE